MRRDLLADDLVLNVTFPFVGPGERLGRAVKADVGRSSDLGLTYAGQPAEALEAFAFAMRLDPHYPAIVLHFVAQAHFALADYNAAAGLLRERIVRNPATDSSRMLLAACYGHLGRIDEARAVWAEMLEVNPEFSLAQRESVLPFKDARDFQRIVEGLKKAGLP